MCLRVFFFKQKTAYEMRISDWSSDVCSSDLPVEAVKDECGKPCLRFGPNRPIQRDGIASPPTAQRQGEVGLVDVPGRDGFLHMVDGGRILLKFARRLQPTQHGVAGPSASKPVVDLLARGQTGSATEVD